MCLTCASQATWYTRWKNLVAGCPRFASVFWTLTWADALSLGRLVSLNLIQRGGGRCSSEIVVRLKIHPELRRHAKVLSQPKGDISADGPLPAHDLINAGKVQCLGQLIGGDSHGLHELSAQNLARMRRNRNSFPPGHGLSPQ